MRHVQSADNLVIRPTLMQAFAENDIDRCLNLAGRFRVAELFNVALKAPVFGMESRAAVVAAAEINGVHYFSLNATAAASTSRSRCLPVGLVVCEIC